MSSLGTATGVGQTLLPSNQYLFACRLLAQKAVLETFLVPSAQALQKRFDLTFCPDEFYPGSRAENLNCASSTKLIEDFHTWFFTQASDAEELTKRNQPKA